MASEESQLTVQPVERQPDASDPKRDSPCFPTQRPKCEAPGRGPEAGRPVVVVAEDDEGLNRLICRRLSRRGVMPVGVRSGADAIAAVLEHPDCLLLLDYVLPDMEGHKLVAELKARGRSVPFIVMTGHGDERIAVEMMKLGARDYLVKLPDILDLMPPVVERALVELETDRKLVDAEEALRAEKERAEEYLDIVASLMVAVDAEDRITLVNRYACEVLGWNESELIGRTWTATCVPKRLRGENPDRFCRPVAGTVRPIDYCEKPVVTHSGEERLIAWHNVLLRNESGKIAGMLSSGEDITERRAAETRLAESELKLRTIFDNTSDGMFVVEQDGHRLSLANSSCLRLLGYTPDEFTSLSVADIHPGEDLPLVVACVESLIRGETLPRGETRFRSKDGSLFLADTNVAGITLDGKKCVLIVFHDITKRKQAEAELAKYRDHLEELVSARTRELEEVNKELETFSYSVSHDLRAPLRAINGFALALQEDYSDQLDPVGRDYVQRVRDASRRMATLIDDLLNLARIARLPLERKSVSLSELARTIAGELRESEPARKVDFVIHDGMTAQADPVLAEMVLRNLLDNAWKFTSKHPKARIEVGETVHDGEPAWYVRDDGAGFDMAHVGSLSAPFQRLHTTAEFAGTGIGLATVQRIVRRHGGRGWIEGAVENGATFSFTLAAPNRGEVAVG